VKRAIAWFAENHVAANLLMLVLIAGGLGSLPAIHQKVFPDINVEVISVGVPYLGAAPEEVEEGVCVRIEEELQGIEGIEKLSSSAAEGACGVSAELITGYPVNQALAEVKNAVDGITTFPEETEKPTVSHVSYRRNALKLALSGDVSEKTLKILGERIRDQISSLPGVTQVDLTNARNYEISVEVPEESLRRHGLTFDQVVGAVRSGSLDRPGGSIKTSGGEVLLRTKGQAYTGEEFERLVVLTREDGTRLLLEEVAQVVDGFEDDDRWAHFDGEPAVLIQVFRVGEQRVLELTERVKAYVAEVATRLPEGVRLTVWQDGARTLRDRLDILIRNGRGGFLLVFVVLALFLRLRLAFWVALGVPISFLGALWLFPVLDLSIDVISLFAFITVLGLLVDDAIVVGALAGGDGPDLRRHGHRGDLLPGLLGGGVPAGAARSPGPQPPARRAGRPPGGCPRRAAVVGCGAGALEARPDLPGGEPRAPRPRALSALAGGRPAVAIHGPGGGGGVPDADRGAAEKWPHALQLLPPHRERLRHRRPHDAPGESGGGDRRRRARARGVGPSHEGGSRRGVRRGRRVRRDARPLLGGRAALHRPARGPRLRRSLRRQPSRRGVAGAPER
jgi:hypothetical protein